jgi:uncharacterized hydrophobic protein (TIGR00271 family)
MQEDRSNQANEEPTSGKVASVGNRAIDEAKAFLYSITHIKEHVDYEGTMTGIKKDIVFKGYNIWILIASIFIAAIGLNANSAAVIIGAMLISPLMGPIVGVGMSMATNDWPLLIRALKNMSIFVLVSIVASSIYFLMTPLGDAASELIGRTRPTFLDVLVAFFGGVAGIVASSRKEKTNVIPGVAIATALMPPLCTAGYGLANGNMDFFFGAFYLFCINCVFIALSTFLVARYLKFPKHNYVNPAREKKVRLYFFVCLLIFIVPSFITLFNTYKHTKFTTNVGRFVKNEIKPIYHFSNVESNLDSLQIIVSTAEFIEKGREDEFRSKLVHYDLAGYKFKLMSQVDYDRVYAEKNIELDEKTKQLTLQANVIQQLRQDLNDIKSDTVAFTKLEKEVKALFPNLTSFAYTNQLIGTNFSRKDTLGTLVLNWEKSNLEDEKRLVDWLKIELGQDSLKVLYERRD